MRKAKNVRVRSAQSRIEALEIRQLLSAAVNEPIAIKFQGNSPNTTSAPTGTTPDQMRHVYGVSDIQFGVVKGDGSGQTLAIIDAYDDPKFISSSLASYVGSDLYQFNAYWRLPQFGTSGGPTFTKVDENGGSSYPSVNNGWDTEIALDVEWAHVIAPKANIVLVEGTSASFSDLNISSINTAKAWPGVTAVSMSFGANEFSSETGYDTYMANQASGHANVAFFASTGDNGALSGNGGGVEYPSSSPYVVAVGGTTLTQSNGVYGSEVGWAYGSDSYNTNGAAGGGVSTYETKPAFQSSVTLSSTQRTVPDIAFDADPSTGVPIYDTINGTTAAPWAQYGGTSLAAPMWGALDTIINQGLAINGQASLTSQQLATKLYGAPSSYFHDVTSGYNGYNAGPGYDLVTGIGTPIANNLVPYLAGSSIVTITSPVLSYTSDAGLDFLDRITNVNKPTVTGKTTLTGAVQVFADGVAVGTGTASNGAYSATLSTALTDGGHNLSVQLSGVTSASTSVTIDTVAPVITSSVFNYSVAAHSLSMTFSEPLSYAPTTATYTVLNNTNSTIVPVGNTAVSYNTSTKTAVLTFPGYTNGTLPNGRYIASNSGLIDIAGNAVSTTSSSFFFLLGDANHDGSVNIGDLGTLATNYGHAGGFSSGDFNYDGTVNIGDLGILATYYGTVLPASAGFGVQALSASAVASGPAPGPSAAPLTTPYKRVADLVF